MINLLAQISNPALPPNLGTIQDAEGSTPILGRLIVMVWWSLMIAAGLAVILYFILAGISWLTAGGDKTKVEEARSRMTNALIGITIVFGTFAIVNFVGPIFGIDFLNLDVVTYSDISGSP